MARVFLTLAYRPHFEVKVKHFKDMPDSVKPDAPKPNEQEHPKPNVLSIRTVTDVGKAKETPPQQTENKPMQVILNLDSFL